MHDACNNHVMQLGHIKVNLPFVDLLYMLNEAPLLNQSEFAVAVYACQ